MGYPLQIAVRYLSSKSRGAFVSVSTAFAVLGVTLGVAALLTVMSVTGGFQSEFREKVLGVNAHVLVLKYSSDFREYREVMEKVAAVPGVVGVAPFTINPMMVSHKEQTATGVLLKGVDPELMPSVLDLPRHIIEGNLDGMRKEGAKPPERKASTAFLPPALPALTLMSADAGPERDDAGRNVKLFNAIEEAVNGTAASKRVADAGPEAAAVAEQDEPADDLDAALPADALVGSAVPKGGYASELPSSDEDLPDDISPDPCDRPDAVRLLPGIVVGSTLAKNLQVKLGSCVQVTSPTIGYSISGGAIRPPVAKQFRVIAVFEAGFDQYDSKLAYADIYEAQGFYDYGDSVTGVEMKVSDISKSDAITAEVEKRIASKMYHTMDWEELNHGLFTALKIQQIGMSAVLALIIVVAAFTVIATLIMVVLEKRREIAVLKAMGASDAAILRVFVYQGGIIGLLGTGSGLLLGLAVCKGLLVYGFPLDPKVYFISRLPVEVSAFEFLLTGAIALSICLFATIVPALYAARLRPADGVRAD